MRLHIWTAPREDTTLTQVLLVGLAALLVAFLSATLGVRAQTSGDEGRDDAIEGRVIARVQDRTGTDGVDHYRIEFGFLPQWAMDEHDPWSEAVTTFSDLLPRARYLTKATIDARRDADNRRWLRSSPISVPASSAGGDALSGRVIARYNPDSRGRLRIEFGFLPEGAFTSTANTQEAVEQYGEQFLTGQRYLSASKIADRRGDWLHSSPITVTRLGPEPAPVIDSISCSPSPAETNRGVTCTARLSGGTPDLDSYSWSSDPSFGSGINDRTSFTFLFSNRAQYTISLTVSNVAGSSTRSVPLSVTGSDAPHCGNSDLSLEEGASRTLIYFCSDPDGDMLTITARSSDTSVATVALSSSAYTHGMRVTVTGVSVGRAIIGLFASDGHWEIANSASVEVVEATTPP